MPGGSGLYVTFLLPPVIKGLTNFTWFRKFGDLSATNVVLKEPRDQDRLPREVKFMLAKYIHVQKFKLPLHLI